MAVKWRPISSSHFGFVGRLGLGVGVKTSLVILRSCGLGGRSGSFRVRAGVKTSLVIDSENENVLTAS